jgi:NADH:ubiquinone oxidoreductase subunit C
MITKHLEKKSIYFRLYIYSILKKYIYGFLGRDRCLIIYIKPKNILSVLTFFKYDSIISVKSLLDIAVLDSPNYMKHKGRFVLNYVFLNYIYEYRFIIKILTDGLNPLFSINKLYSSSN